MRIPECNTANVERHWPSNFSFGLRFILSSRIPKPVIRVALIIRPVNFWFCMARKIRVGNILR